MSKDYSIFRKYPTIDQAAETETILKKEGIQCIIGDNVSSLDSNFGASSLNNEIEIRIKQSDFLKAEEILQKNAEDLIENIEEDYYLFEFSNEELYDILVKQDEWNEFDYNLAKKILKDKGQSVSNEFLKSLKTERLKQLAKPEPRQTLWIVIGYASSILGGFIGMIIGYFLWTSKKTLPNGQKVYSYSRVDRWHGKVIFYLGCVVFPVLLIYRLIGF